MINTTNRVPRDLTKQSKSCFTKVLPILGIIVIGIIAYVVMDNSKMSSATKDNSLREGSNKSLDNTESHQKAALDGGMNLVKEDENKVKDLENSHELGAK